MIQGNISVKTENIFPIIKKFLYSDQEIFLRELVSNAIDATSKIQTLSRRGDLHEELGDLSIQVSVDTAAKTVTISDRGIGMTQAELEKYLNDVAFSGATEFLEKYKGETTMIGHFGLGFYSAFMVAAKVEVVTRSYKKNADAWRWTCDGTPHYTIEPTERAERGTDIVLHIAPDAEEYLEKSKISELLNKYCKFLPVPIHFDSRSEEEKMEKEADAKADADLDKDSDTDGDAPVANEFSTLVNNVAPLWKKAPSDLTDEDYKNFYKEIHPASPEPLFWVHLNIDYPFNLTGVLYFPQHNGRLDLERNKVQLYSNQVYVTDNVRDILPEYLTLLHGVIDSPDIPLNVSRSYLQSDKEVKKITTYITRKVADKLNELFKNNRTDFESKWKDIAVFIKYGMLSDEKFHERALPFVLLENIDKQRFTVEEYQEKVKPLQTNKTGDIVFIYASDYKAQDSYVKEAKSYGYDVLNYDSYIDNHFFQHLEMKNQQKIRFARVDSDTMDNLVAKDDKKESVLSETEQNQVKEVFTTMLKNDGAAKIELKPLSPESAPVQIVKNEWMRRMKEMQKMSGQNAWGDFGNDYQVIVNSNHPLIADKMLKTNDLGLARHLYDLALLNQGMLTGAELSAFVERSLKFVQ
jgi:molecular chaperone HtpG